MLTPVNIICRDANENASDTRLRNFGSRECVGIILVLARELYWCSTSVLSHLGAADFALHRRHSLWGTRHLRRAEAGRMMVIADLLRLIDKHISLAFVREKLKESYSDTGRPSIDPELLLRILLIGYLYGITSERKLVEELRMHLAWRWFTGLGFDKEIPHHSTFSKNRHGRFQESKLFEQLFEQIVRQCVEVGLVQGTHFSVDGSFIEANAAKESRIPREQLAEAAQVHHTVRQYLREVEEQNPVEEPVHTQDQVSSTDPDSTYATKGGTPARLGYYDNYLVDNHSCVIVGVQATAARMSQETVAAQDMLTRFTQWLGREPESVAADTTYGNGEFLQWLADRSITPYMRTRDSIHRKRSPFFGPERFTYEPENNRYICPAGQFLNYGGQVYRNRAFNYIGTRKKCGPCLLRPQCTSALPPAIARCSLGLLCVVPLDLIRNPDPSSYRAPGAHPRLAVAHK